jgi:hypothetical protein
MDQVPVSKKMVIENPLMSQNQIYLEKKCSHTKNKGRKNE